MPFRATVLLLLAGVLAACTSSAGTPAPTRTVTSTTTATSPPPPTAPVVSGPTTAAAARSCPLLATSFVRSTMGMRLGRLTVLRSAGRVVGCRFYALQGSPLHTSEHLPGPKQPVVEVLTQRYPTPTAAHNAFARLAAAGRNPQQVDLGRAGTGVCYQTDFYPRDGGRDWACGGNVGTVRVLVRTVDTTGTFGPAAVTRAVLPHV